MTAASPTPALPPPTAARLPGLALAAAIAVLSLWAAERPWLQDHGLSALTVAIVLGIAFGNTLYPQATMNRLAAPGVGFAKHWLLRAGIVLYGLRLTVQDIASVGTAGIVLDVLVVTSTFALACWLGTRLLGLRREQAMLIGAGSAICGAAAVMAAEPVVRGRAAEVTVAVSTVVAFGTLAMFLYPAIYPLLQSAAAHGPGWLAMDAHAFGVFTGATVHEVAQVVAAGRAISAPAADAAVITKMVRVMVLAPFLLGLSWHLARGRDAAPGVGRAPVVVPWFAFGFMAMVGFNSLHWLPAALQTVLLQLDTLLLAMAMAALGLTTQATALRRAGLKPLLLAALLMVWLVGGGLALHVLLGSLLG